MKIDLIGYNIDNLLKILYTKKITLFNVVRHEHNKVSFEILDKDYKKVKRHIANFKVKQTLSKAKQLPKFILANLGVILGCFVGILFGIFASNYIWQIKIYGIKDLQESEIISVLSENGIRKGKINHQTSEEIENILLNHYDRIAQVSVTKRGTAIIINLSEKLVYSEETYEPIMAKYSGIIKEINIITGTTNVKVGDYVNVGDILVLPFNINANGEKVSVKPLAEIKAEIFIVSKCEMKKQEIVLVRTGNVRVAYDYNYKNKKLFSGKIKNSFALFETVVYNENVSDIIPLNRNVYHYYELKESVIEHNFELEKDSLNEKSKQQAYKMLPAGEIMSEKVENTTLEATMFSITSICVYASVI